MTQDGAMNDLAAVRRRVADYFAALPLEAFYRRVGDAWAPADDLRHLTLSVEKVTQAFRLPSHALEARFGAPSAASRSRDEVGAVALAGLKAGGKATPEISPEPIAEEDRTGAFRAGCLAAWEAAARGFEEAVAALDDAALDRHQLPHPFLGPFTLREWLHFHVLHGDHHVRVAAARVKAAEAR